MSPAHRLPALRLSPPPAWVRHAAWFALWWLVGFTATLAVVAW